MMSAVGKPDPWWMSDYRGAQWFRADLHLHTPGVDSFACPSGLDPRNEGHKARIIAEYVAQLHKQSIKLAAITDYNGVREEWFAPIRDEASKYGITVLPGAELDFASGGAGKHGLHVLAVFDGSAEPRDINQVICSMDKNRAGRLFADDGSHKEIELDDSLEKTLDTMRSLKPVIVFPHPNEDKGLFKTYAPAAQARIISACRPHAIECFKDGDRKRLLLTREIGSDILDRIASVEFSDPKSVDEIGTKSRPSGCLRATYLKLSTLDDITAIALAMSDPEVMVRVNAVPETRYTRLIATEVEGSGFLGGTRVVWSPELTSIIGGRGTGKSAIVEAVRYALGISPFVETEYRANLVRHSLGSGGKVSVWVEKRIGSVCRTYRVERVFGERTRVYETNTDGSEVLVNLLPSEIVGDDALPLLFGQREIYSIAVDKLKRVKLMDDVIGRIARDKQLEIRKREEELRSNAIEVSRFRRMLAENEDKKTNLRSICHEIESYQKEGLSDKLKEMTLLSTDEEILRRIVSQTGRVSDILGPVQAEIEEYRRDISRLSSQAQSPNQRIVKDAAEAVLASTYELQLLLSSAKSKVAAMLDALTRTGEDWQAARAPYDEAVRKIKQSLGDQALDPDRLDWLTREQTKISGELDVLSKVQKDLENALNRRQVMLEGLRYARYGMFTLRRQQADLLTSGLRGQVRVAVEYRGNDSEYMSRLGGLFAGSKVDKATLKSLCSRADMTVTDGQYIAEVARKGGKEFEMEFGLSPNRTHQIVTWLNQEESRLHELEMLYPDDEVRISMNIDGLDVPVDKLSDGQRATAVLMILLEQEDRPLIVDQPEDDLDNRFIYESIVRILREQKAKRQIITATHNPNIPVLGDAELILALETRENKSVIREIGSIDRRVVREAVKRIMEGGEDAFRRRARKYGSIDGEARA